MHDACVCDIRISLLIRPDKVASLQADQVSNLGILQAATQVNQVSTLGTSSPSSPFTPDKASHQVSAPQTLPAQAPQVLVSQAATGQTVHVCPQIPRIVTPQTALVLSGQAGAPPQLNVLASLATAQVCSISAQGGTLQVSYLDTAQGTALPAAQVCTLDTAQATAPVTAQGTALVTAQVCTLDTAEATALNTAQGTASDAAQGTASDTAQGTALDAAQGTALVTAQVCTLDTAKATAPNTAQGKAHPDQETVSLAHESACEPGDE